ncbi:c-type cytochrome [Aquifex aeolicus]|uniref:Uncharacterized protein aq_1854 n=1 Tax=Aquifex aeolicus (strain VF5) TaxID=224324 RepID=Y1854_AQUAE|nr:cytochrome c [Aquifex aeolicus]O67706.1 RecName: Full=Uncharacterized protein aq_1854; Flags: Precursor [Aquifex aeolicus VF5]AAC07670.1 putative protein [Aquifex aeolicus VF5]
MRKLLISLALAIPVFAVDHNLLQKGYEVYKKHCSACHIERATPEQIKKFRMMAMRGEKLPIAAPPMNEVSARVKKFYPGELEFITFVKDYITNPSREKGVCMPMAFKLFGVMPPIGKALSEEEKEAVAYWLYHNYKESWKEMMRKMHGKMMH